MGVKDWKRIFGVLVTVVALAACGGGGGGSDGGSGGLPGGDGTSDGNNPGGSGDDNPGGDGGDSNPSVLASVVLTGQDQTENSDARVVVDANGNAIAIWATRDKLASSVTYPPSRVWAARYVAGNGWQTPVALEEFNVAGQVIEDTPSIALDRNSGRAMVVWAKRDGGPNDYHWAAAFDPVTGWGKATKLRSVMVGNLDPAAVGVDGEGNALVAWPEVNNAGIRHIYAARYESGSGWSSPTQVGSPAVGLNQETNARIVVSPAGDAVLVWSMYQGSRTDLWTNRFDKGRGWGTASLLVATEGKSYEQSIIQSTTRLAMDANGRAILAWGQADYNAQEKAVYSGVWTKRYDGGWQSENTQVGSPMPTTGFVPKLILTMNAQGAAAVAWPGADGSLRAAVSTPGGVWGPETYLKTEGPFDFTIPSLGIDGNGNVKAVWTRTNQTNPSRANLWHSKYSAGSSSWSTPEMLYDDPAVHVTESPFVDTNDRGDTALIWLQKYLNGSGRSVLTSYFPVGTW